MLEVATGSLVERARLTEEEIAATMASEVWPIVDGTPAYGMHRRAIADKATAKALWAVVDELRSMSEPAERLLSTGERALVGGIVASLCAQLEAAGIERPEGV